MFKRMIQASDFDIDISTIPEEILNYPLSARRKSALEREYGSVYDFIVVLYHLRFVERLEARDIAIKLGLDNQSAARIALYNFGWHHSVNYLENMNIYKNKLTEAQRALEEAKENSRFLEASVDHKLQAALNKHFRKVSYERLGFNTNEEYIRVLYYLSRVKKLLPRDLMIVFDLTHGTMQSHLRKIGINYSHPEGMRNKAERGDQDYGKTRRHAKNTKAKSMENSNLQDYARVFLSTIIDDYFDNNVYEVIVGMSNTEILGKGKEIDIPLIVYDVDLDLTHRFAVEYNAPYYHPSEQRDEYKRETALRKGWHYFTIIDESRFSNNPKLLKSRIHELCKKIKHIVENLHNGLASN